MNFLPGQYVDLIAKGVRRSYSIANAPRSDGTLELHVRRYPGGVMSNHLFDHAMDGELMRLQGPLGTFFRREERTGPMLFLATGTGIAPVKALLEEIAADPSATAGRPIAVYWGNREPEDVYWQPPESAGVRVVPVLSRALPDYAGRRGYVQDALLADWPDLRGAEVYACGSQAMIQAAEKPLVDAGLDPHAFHYDAFVSSD
jgi:CDP-4-dehydro-6-deoxyglucose reductase